MAGWQSLALMRQKDEINGSRRVEGWTDTMETHHSHLDETANMGRNLN
jgi:hypothetical protein